MIPRTFVYSRDWGISESLMLPNENFNNTNSIDIQLRYDVLFEFRRRDKETLPLKYSIFRGIYI